MGDGRVELEGFGIEYIEKRAMWTEAVRETARMLASEPYGGHQGRFFSMPPRNVVPKPLQRPHPPLWVACTSRETVRLAARLGLGALTFAFMDANEARFWIEEYYEAFEASCHPIGRSVNPNVAVLAGTTCHPDRDVALKRGLAGQRFFKWALAYYFRFGTHVPGRTRLWDEFRNAPVEAMAGLGAIGTPKDVAEHLRALEDAGVDQVIFLQQAASYEHDHICETLELLGSEVLPEFIDRHPDEEAAKRERLAPAVARALDSIEPLPSVTPAPVEAYPVLWERQGAEGNQGAPGRALDAASVWKLHVDGGSGGS